MSQSPVTDSSAESPDGYLGAWQRLALMIQGGRSFSGHERNCSFLNVGTGHFVDVSYASGLDLIDDGRAIADVDWDHDGDLDLWMANRTGPRVRLMRNDLAHNNHFVSFQLQGDPSRGCNRDAIGARVEVVLGGKNTRTLTRTLRAGDGFLSQSSKWLHFGLGAAVGGEAPRISRVIVHWPGHQPAEEITGVAADGRYQIVQGDGTSHLVPRRATTPELRPSSNPPLEDATQQARIWLSHRIDVPDYSYRGLDSETRSIHETRSGATLVNLWASWCQPCLSELKELAAEQDVLEELGLTVIALNTDELSGENAGERTGLKPLVEKLGLPFAIGVADEELVRRISELTQRPIYPKRQLPLPTSLLIDGQRRLAAVYKGPVSVQQLREDISNLTRLSSSPRDLAVPFAGTWADGNFKSDPMTVAAIYFEGEYYDDARRVMQDHLAKEPGPPSPEANDEARNRNRRLADVHRMLGRIAAAEGHFSDAVRSFREAVRFRADWPEVQADIARAFTRWGVQHKRDGNVARAIEQFVAAMHEMRDWPPAANNLAWIYSTSHDVQYRNGSEAVRLAESVCRASGYREPRALDTLAAAYAETGRFDDAVSIAEQACRLSSSAGNTALTAEIESRLRLYRDRKSFRE